MSQNLLDTIEINTAEQCEFAVIWLHGLGASGNDFEPIVGELQLPESPGVRFVFPHAPIRPITINGGASMRGWYDINSLDFGEREQDSAGIKDSAAHVNALIEAEISNGIAPANILLAGFSQGGAIALYTGLTTSHTLCGILALSTYLPIHDETLASLTEHAQKVPIFMTHGEFDDVINLHYAERSRDLMLKHKLNVQWQQYPMGHNVSQQQIADIAAWMKSQFGM
ncbi:MAG: carboxylesterase [Granulosicoccus sp.]|nr:carboxylesterase [Granulosicoccus sp.]